MSKARTSLADLKRTLGLAATFTLVGCYAHAKTSTHHLLLSDGIVAPATPAESEALAKLRELDPTKPHTLSGALAVGPAYDAGSGRLCRTVGAKLACQGGDGWVFVPEVFEVTP